MAQFLPEKEINTGVDIIKNGGTVAFRTETVWGLGADANNPAAVQKVFDIKKRPAQKNLVLQFASAKDAARYFPDMDKATFKILKTFKKGLTVALSDIAAVRIPSDGFAKKFLRACGMPLVVTSANTSGKPSPKTWHEVRDDIGDTVDAIFIGKPCEIGKESTIIKIEENGIKIIRQGYIAPQKLEKKTKMKTYI